MASSATQQRYSKDVWVPRFAMRLRAIRRSIQGANAMEIASTEYYLFPDVEPEEAARTYAQVPEAANTARF